MEEVLEKCQVSPPALSILYTALKCNLDFAVYQITSCCISQNLQKKF